MPKLKKITSLAHLRSLASADPAYKDLAIRAAENLGGQAPTLDAALRWLETNAVETTEEGVIAEINFCRNSTKPEETQTMKTNLLPKPPVVVEYDAKGKRASKKFDDANEAKAFYAAKLKAGKAPKVLKDRAAAKSNAQAAEHQQEAQPASQGEAAADKPRTPATAADKAPAAGRDRFGARLGTSVAKFNAVLSAEPKTMAALMKEAGLTGTHYNHCKKLLAAGHIKKTKDGYRLA